MSATAATLERAFTTTKVALGQTVTTRGVSAVLDYLTILSVLSRHARGDWGDLSAGDKAMNDRAVQSGDDRLLSRYNGLPTVTGETADVYVITEWDRSVTTVLLPEEYVTMAIEKDQDGNIVVSGEADVRRVQHVAQKFAMRLELRTGMTHSGGSLIARIRKHYGFKGSRQSVYSQFCAMFGLEE